MSNDTADNVAQIMAKEGDPIVLDQTHIVVPTMCVAFGFPIVVITLLCLVQRRNRSVRETRERQSTIKRGHLLAAERRRESEHKLSADQQSKLLCSSTTNSSNPLGVSQSGTTETIVQFSMDNTHHCLAEDRIVEETSVSMHAAEVL